MLPILGDAVDGDGIYGSQTHEQEISNPDEQAEGIAEVLEKFIRAQSRVWKKVRVVCVPGNHGRAGKAAAEACNWDITAYRYLGHRLRDSGVSVKISKDPWLEIIPASGGRILAHHGNMVKPSGATPWTAFQQRHLRWHSTREYGQFGLVVSGHVHSHAIYSSNQFTHVSQGTAMRGDKYALHTMGWESSNLWFMVGFSGRPVPNWIEPIDLAAM